jgi:hypothetical protein
MSVVTEYVIDEPAEDYWANDLYFGPPSEESEAAWDAMIFRKLPIAIPNVQLLIQSAHGLQVFPHEAKHFDALDTVRLKNGNPLFIMGVNHNLHCLVRLSAI